MPVAVERVVAAEALIVAKQAVTHTAVTVAAEAAAG